MVIEFDSFDQAVACINPAEYSELSVIRDRSTKTSTVIVDGV